MIQSQVVSWAKWPFTPVLNMSFKWDHMCSDFITLYITFTISLRATHKYDWINSHYSAYEWEQKQMERTWIIMAISIIICVYVQHNQVGIDCFGALRQNTSHNGHVRSEGGKYRQPFVISWIHSTTWVSTLQKQSLECIFHYLWKWLKVDKLKIIYTPFRPVFNVIDLWLDYENTS